MTKRIFAAATCLCAVVLAGSWQARTQTPQSGRPVLEAYVSAWNRHDFAALEKLLAADAIHEDIAQGFRGKGLAQIRDFMRAEIEGEPDLDWRLTTVVDAGPMVAAEWTWTGTFTGDSPIGPVVRRLITGRGASIAVIENGRIKRFSDYYDMASFFPKVPTGGSSVSAANTEQATETRETSVEQEIRRLEDERAEAFERGDVELVKRMSSDDYIATSVTGQVKNKAQVLEEMISGGRRLKFVHDDIRVRVYGNTAVITGRSTRKGRENNNDVDDQVRFTGVYMKQNGRWLKVAQQATRIGH